jgi:ribulose-phosphate 3-epimerase
MDGIFVPQISFGQPVLRSIRALSNLPFDVHLMTIEPEKHVESFAESGADLITFHLEATTHHCRLIDTIHGLGKKCGVAIVPSTNVVLLDEILPFIDLVLVMTVNPGFGGQKMLDFCLNKVAALKKAREIKNLDFKISVDGGITNDNLQKAICAGTDIAVSGSSFFSNNR